MIVDDINLFFKHKDLSVLCSIVNKELATISGLIK